MNNKNKKTAQEIIDSIVNMPPSDTDPNGSYTGRPVDENAVPVQDADDLYAGSNTLWPILRRGG